MASSGASRKQGFNKKNRIAPAPMIPLHIDVNATSIVGTDVTGAASAKVTRTHEAQTPPPTSRKSPGHQRHSKSVVLVLSNNKVIKPFNLPVGVSPKVFIPVNSPLGSTPKSGSLKSPKNLQSIDDMARQAAWNNIPGSIPEDRRASLRHFQSQGDASNLNATFTSPFYTNPDGTVKRISPSPFESSQVDLTKDEKEPNATATLSKMGKESFKSTLGLSSLSRARTFRDVPKLTRNHLDDFIRIAHYLAANVELYTLANETVPDCLRDMQSVVMQDLGDVTVKISKIQKIASQGEDYQSPSNGCLNFKFFNRKKPAVLNQETKNLLTLLSLPTNEDTFIYDLNKAYERVIALCDQKKQPSTATPAATTLSSQKG